MAEYVDVDYVREVLQEVRTDVDEELSLDLSKERAVVIAQRIIEDLSKEFSRGLTPRDLGFFITLDDVLETVSEAHRLCYKA